MKAHYKIRLSSIISLCLLFCVLNIRYFHYYNDKLYQIVRWGCLLFALIYIFAHIRFLGRKFLKINSLIVLYSILTLYTTYIRNGINSNFILALFNGILYCCLFFFYEICSRCGCIDNCLKANRNMLFFIALTNDLIMFVVGNINYGGNKNEVYLLGNKFNVGYLHILLLAILLLTNSKKKLKWRDGLSFALVGLINAYTGCTTLLVATIGFYFLYCWNRQKNSIFLNTVFYWIYFVACSFLLVFFSGLLNIAPIKFLITSVLHEDLTLTGRLTGYGIMGELILKSPLLGYGYRNNIMFTSTEGAIANTQNGIFDIMLSYGIPVSIILIAIGGVIISSLKEISINSRVWSLISIIYIFITVSIVEIPFGATYIFLLSLLNAVAFDNFEKTA